jgi:hypothetical protein
LLTIAAPVLIARPGIRGIRAQTIAIQSVRLPEPFLVAAAEVWRTSIRQIRQENELTAVIPFEPPSRQDRRIVPPLHR